MKKLKLFLIGAAILAIIVFLAVGLNTETGEPGRVSLLSEETYAAILSSQTETEPHARLGRLLLDGLAAPYADGKYFLSESESFERLIFRLTWSQPGCDAYFMPDAAMSDFALAISGGHIFHLLVSNGETYFIERVVVTSLPVLSLTDDVALSYKTGADTGAMFRLFAPDGTPTESISSYRLRGGSSRRHPKHSYRITLYGGRHKQQALPLLGMRQSEDWILLALYTDHSRMREKVALDLWNAVAATNPEHNVPGSSFEYVEVISDGVYIGLYGLVTPVDETQCGVAQNRDARLFKVIEYMWDYVQENYRADRRSLSEIIELKYPKKTDGDAAWEPMYRYVDSAIMGEDASVLAPMVDRENLIDHALYLAICSAVDNTFKNVYYLWRPGSDGTDCFTKFPWDLNYTFGDTHDEKNELRTSFSEDTFTRRCQPDDLSILLSGPDGAALGLQLEERYTELRKTIFSEEALVSAFQAQQALLLKSGVFGREKDKWAASEPNADLSEIEYFIHEHMRYLDEAYGLAGQE